MTAKVELVYDRDCPNADGARGVLRVALNAAGLEPQWIEWDRGEATSPAYTTHYGSPTILVNGEDVSGEGGESDANSCRVYKAPDGTLQGVPSVESVLAALRRAEVG